MAISPQRLTIYLYSAHRAVIFAIARTAFLSITAEETMSNCRLDLKLNFFSERVANLWNNLDDQSVTDSFNASSVISCKWHTSSAISHESRLTSRGLEDKLDSRWVGRLIRWVFSSWTTLFAAQSPTLLVGHRLVSYLVGFYRAMHFSAKRGIAIACRLSICPSVCLSVRPSVCNVSEL